MSESTLAQAGPDAGRDPARSANVRRRNSALALALVFFTISSMFIFGLDGHMIWLMWRDAPIVSAALALAAAFFALRWWRTPRS